MKRSRINPGSKRDDRTMEKKLDALWQKAVIARAKGRCEQLHCGKPATVAHHISCRDNKALRHVLNNGFACCQHHHDKHHEDPVGFLTMLKIFMPERFSCWAKRHALLTVPYWMWMEERMKELKS